MQTAPIFSAPTSTGLWLLRHARPLLEQGCCYGRLDVDADAQHTALAAHAFARAWAQRQADEMPILKTSPLRRCTALAQQLGQYGQAALAQAWAVDERLAEMDFGRWEGLAWDAINRTELDDWAANFAHYRPGGARSLAQMLPVVGQALVQSWSHAQLAKAQTPDRSFMGFEAGYAPRRDVVWITHAGVVRCVQWLLLHGLAQLPTDAAQWNTMPAPAWGQWLMLPWGCVDDGLKRLRHQLKM